jgi:hypothetical protein
VLLIKIKQKSFKNQSTRIVADEPMIEWQLKKP